MGSPGRMEDPADRARIAALSVASTPSAGRAELMKDHGDCVSLGPMPAQDSGNYPHDLALTRTPSPRGCSSEQCGGLFDLSGMSGMCETFTPSMHIGVAARVVHWKFPSNLTPWARGWRANERYVNAASASSDLRL